MTYLTELPCGVYQLDDYLVLENQSHVKDHLRLTNRSQKQQSNDKLLAAIPYSENPVGGKFWQI